MNLTYMAFGLGFAVFGILFSLGKVHGHISAWKAMSDEEKERILIGPLCRNIGEVITLCGFIFLIYGMIPGIRQHWFWVAMIAWLIVASLDLFWIEKSNRYQKEEAVEKKSLALCNEKGERRRDR